MHVQQMVNYITSPVGSGKGKYVIIFVQLLIETSISEQSNFFAATKQYHSKYILFYLGKYSEILTLK